MVRRLIFSGLLISAFFAGSADGADGDDGAPLKIAVAANFKPLLKQLAPQFEKQYPHKLSLSSASTGILYAQIHHGAPFDVFLAADEQRPQLLFKAQLTVGSSPQTYAVGQLVLWYKTKDAVIPDKALLSGWPSKIAMANAKTAPYGLAAKSVLQKLGLWQQKRPQLVTGTNVAQTQQFVESGNVQLGFVGLSQVIGRAKGQYWQLPTPWYPPLKQQVVVLKRSQHLPAAKTFVNWLLSAKIQQQIVDGGYGSAVIGD